MQEKREVALAFNRAIVEKAAKLAIPEKEVQAGYIVFAKDQFFRMQVKLGIQGIKFR